MKSIFQDETSLRIYEAKPDEGFRLKQFYHLREDKQRVEEAENPEVLFTFSHNAQNRRHTKKWKGRKLTINTQNCMVSIFKVCF